MKIAIWNCAGTGNLGDDLCLEGMKAFCYETFGHDITFQNFFKLNEHTVKKIEGFDYLAIGGGQLLDCSDFLLRLTDHNPGLKYFFAGVGIGAEGDLLPYLDRIKPEFWHVRDKASADILRACGVAQTIIEGEDLSSKVRIPERRPPQRRLGFNFKNVGKSQSFVLEMAKLLDHLDTPFFVFCFNSLDPGTKEIDGELCAYSDGNGYALAEGIRGFMEKKDLMKVLFYNSKIHNPAYWAAYLGLAEFLICERYHAAVLAHRLGIPFRAIPYHAKVERFLKERGMSERSVAGTAADIQDAIFEHWGGKNA